MLNETEVANITPKNPKVDNLTKLERLAIKQLFKNRDITIKPADKGYAVVILDTAAYIAKAERQLSDPNFYSRQDCDLTPVHNSMVQQVLSDMLARDEIDQSCHNFLYQKEPKTPRFYTLPKIHKSTQPPPGHPILSANQSPTEQISAFVDYFLKPTIPYQRSYVKDTTHFLQILQGIPPLPPESHLVTLDVTSLYTNIPNKEGIRAVAKTLAKYRPGAQHPNNQSLVQLLGLVLNKNNFEFNGEHYLQTSGTAMGTRVAPSFANTFMGDFEETHVYTSTPTPQSHLYGSGLLMVSS